MSLFYRNHGVGSLVNNAILKRLEIIIVLLATIVLLIVVLLVAVVTLFDEHNYQETCFLKSSEQQGYVCQPITYGDTYGGDWYWYSKYGHPPVKHLPVKP